MTQNRAHGLEAPLLPQWGPGRFGELEKPQTLCRSLAGTTTHDRPMTASFGITGLVIWETGNPILQILPAQLWHFIKLQ